ncbi:hypothetical protein O4328_28195 [Rhodococcus opacus]|uniref:Uncharacterized protein n=1 Tax=Rhodococcus opacus TaxID=37919 RepID=A0AAX3YLB7_RHOOP|nr:hypothetical protein [Rhodococcus opacus]MCZ4587521.1 hypothetical protein [Rhodococcus opacus]WLF49096.1 hypothetical protein Q5707_08950 [Rhodococcus opacus]
MLVAGAAVAVIYGLASLLQEYAVVGFLVIACPLGGHILSTKLSHRRALWPTPSFIASVSYTIFFGSGYLEYLVTDRSINFYTGTVDLSDALHILIVTSVATSGFCLGALIVCGSNVTVVVSSDADIAVMRVFSITLFFLAFAGAILTIVGFGSVTAAVNAFASHDRNTGIAAAGAVGSSLWGVFNLPAMISSACVIASGRATRLERLTAGWQFAIVFLVSIVVYASRLTVILAYIGVCAVVFAYKGIGIRPRYGLLALVAFILCSAVILAQRGATESIFKFTRMLEVLSYAIFDVSVAGTFYADHLSDQLAPLSRVFVVLQSAVPRSGLNSREISASRVDVIVVRAIGNSAQAESSGLPPSMPTFLYLAYGLTAAVVVSGVLGVVSGLMFKFLLSRRSVLGGFFTGLFVAFLFNVYKGGDLALDLASESRRWLYLMVLYFLVDLAIRRRRVLDFSKGAALP